MSNNPYSASCTSILGSGSLPSCFDLQVNFTTFSYFGAFKLKRNAAVWVNPEFGMSHHGTVIDLDSFRGNIQLYNNTFFSNIL